MVLIFLRDWRSALIVVLNIPFALLAAVILLWATGQTINIMTLGGLALAVGVLVDEATVEIENIHTRMLPGVSRARAVVEACRRTAMARLLSMFCILAVFVPSFFMVGRGAAVVRPALAGGGLLDDRVLSAVEQPGAGLLHLADAGRPSRRGAAKASSAAFARFYCAISESCCACAGRWRSLYLGGVQRGSSALLLRASAPKSFPTPTRRLLRIRLRAPAGTRVEETERNVLRALDVIRDEVGAEQHRHHQRFRRRRALQLSGRPDPPVHQRPAGSHHPGCAQARSPARRSPARAAARSALAASCPTSQVSFEAGDIVSQVMSFGSPTPIEVAVQGVSLADDYAYAAKGARRTGQAALPARPAVRAGTQLPHPRHHHRPRARRAVRTHAWRTCRAPWCPPLRRRASRSPTTGAIPIPATPSRFRCSCRRIGCRASPNWATCPSCSDGRPRTAARRRRRDQARHHARHDRALQRPARGQPHRQHPRHHAGRSRARS